MTEILDENQTFGTKHLFTFGRDQLVICEKRWFSRKVIRKIPLDNIRKIEYIKPDYSAKVIFKKIVIDFLIALLPGQYFIERTRAHVRLSYDVEGDEAVGDYESKISDIELDEMRSYIEN